MAAPRMMQHPADQHHALFIISEAPAAAVWRITLPPLGHTIAVIAAGSPPPHGRYKFRPATTKGSGSSHRLSRQGRRQISGQKAVLGTRSLTATGCCRPKERHQKDSPAAGPRHKSWSIPTWPHPA